MKTKISAKIEIQRLPSAVESLFASTALGLSWFTTVCALSGNTVRGWLGRRSGLNIGRGHGSLVLVEVVKKSKNILSCQHGLSVLVSLRVASKRVFVFLPKYRKI